MNEEQLKPITETPVENKPNIVDLTIQKNNQQEKEETIKELPTWNIEPPIEIKRGN